MKGRSKLNRVEDLRDLPVAGGLNLMWHTTLGDGDALYRSACAVLQTAESGEVLHGFLHATEKKLRR
jgi:hypothetical protein